MSVYCQSVLVNSCDQHRAFGNVHACVLLMLLIVNSKLWPVEQNLPVKVQKKCIDAFVFVCLFVWKLSIEAHIYCQ